MKLKIKHIDGVSDVIAKGIVSGREVNLQYNFEGMTYGITLSLPQAVEMGIVKKVRANNNFRELKEGVIYSILSSYRDECFFGKAGDLLIKIDSGGGFHYSNFYPVL